LKLEELEQLVQELKPWEWAKDHFLYREFVTELYHRAPKIPKPEITKSADGNPVLEWGAKVFRLFPGYVKLELHPIRDNKIMVSYSLGHFNGANVEGAWDRSNDYFECWVVAALVDEWNWEE
jgi:hypothetical protein